MNSSSPARVLGVFALTTMSIAAIFSLRNLPIAAMYGFSAVTFYVLAALVFFIPTSFICARLAAAIPKTGGLYVWVREALGPRFGFLAIWLEWTNTVIAFPMMIAFILFTLIFPFAPHLAKDRLFDFSLLLVVFWGITILNFYGIKTSSWFSAVCVIIGTLFPAVLIVILGIVWFSEGHQLQIHFSASGLIPNFKFATLAFLIAIINGYSGIQIAAFHAQETKSPTKTYPLAIFFTVLIITSLSIMATLAIAIVMPHQAPSVIGGLIQSFSTFLAAFDLGWLTPIIAFCIAFGVLAEINAWMIGPSKGMFAAAERRQLPKLFAQTNNKGVPVAILVTQAIIGSLLGLAYIFMPSVNSAYWLLSDMTAQFTLLMWLFIFISCLYFCVTTNPLRQEYFSKHRGLLILAAVVAFLVCLSIFIISFIPPTAVIQESHVLRYEGFLISGVLIFTLVPIIWQRYQLKQNFMTTR